MENKIKWMYDEHPEAMKQVVMKTPAIKDGFLSRAYGSALYLLTGMESVWSRLKKYVNEDGINFKGMLAEPLSRGELLIVKLAENLSDGGTFVDFTPIDFISNLDDDMLKLAINGIIFRRENPTVAMLKMDDERTYIVTEWCPNCESEIEMRWDTDTQGFKAFCPVCGQRLMLCDECHQLSGSCSYDSKTDSCEFNQKSEEKMTLRATDARNERRFIKAHINGVAFENDVCRDQLRCLWTAYCLRYNLVPDTRDYDNDLLSLWQKMDDANNGGESETADWSDFDSFDLYMGAYLA